MNRNLLLVGVVSLIISSMFLPTIQAQNELIFYYQYNESDFQARLSIDSEYTVEYTVHNNSQIVVDLESQVFPSDLYELQSQLLGFEYGFSDQDSTILYFDYANLFLNMTYDPPEAQALDSIIQSFISRFNQQGIWVLSTEVSIMESYLEQYGISTIIQRGNDYLDVVYEFDVELLVYDNFYEHILLGNTSLLTYQSERAEIAASATPAQISFNTFSLSVDYRPADVSFIINLPEYGVYYVYASDFVGPVYEPFTLNHTASDTGNNTFDQPGDGVGNQASFWEDLPVVFVVPSLVTIGIITRKRR